MLHTKESQVQTKKEQISVLQYHGSNIVFQEVKGKMMINATQMAKPFGKKVKDWRKTQQFKELTRVLTKGHIIPLTDFVGVTHGGSNPGTWLNEELALVFAQWLSPEFYLACNRKLKEILTKQAIVVEPKYGVLPIIDPEKGRIYGYMDAMRSLGGSTKSSCSRRKKAHPQHFVMRYGRNFVSEHYLELLHSYYHYKNNVKQLTLPF